LDEKALHTIFRDYNVILTIEDGCKKGGFGSAILEFANLHSYENRIEILGLPDVFMEQGTIEELHHIAGIDKAALLNDITRMLDELP